MFAPSPFSLRSCHGRAALRARRLIARLPDRVRQSLPTLRADASSARPSGRRSAHSSASTDGFAAPASTTRSETSWHDVSPCLPQALPPGAATRHRKLRLGDISAQKRRNNLIHLPAEESDYPDAGRKQQGFQWCGNRAADENIWRQFQKLFSAIQQLVLTQAPQVPPGFLPIFQVDEQDAAGRVKYRRDATLMVWNRQPHTRRKGMSGSRRSTGYHRSKFGQARPFRPCKMPGSGQGALANCIEW
jgi:hypothetical protein